ncbi:integral membrane [Pyrenophora seminiperda CCB06]|uniref:Integral membrane n=1 Tax=Pyrenophora seminiperda CCB06 TaxID=1302712 RepID=A0A3M7M5R8_9PLEO|nr:integral membrane [Pyrenophora seminiperda CCB06]
MTRVPSSRLDNNQSVTSRNNVQRTTMKNFKTSALGLLALAYQTSAQIASLCPSKSVCYRLNIPQNTASSGSGDIFFQITGPSNYEWIALGQGSGMSQANMFLVYTSANGNNVTLSPRTTTGHNPPSFNSNSRVELLEGSGISNGVMTANIKCSNCNSWNGNTMDFSSANGNWVYAFHDSAGPKNSDDTDVQISQHSTDATFTWDFASAKGGSDANPFLTAAATTPTTTSGNGNSGVTVISASGQGSGKKKLIAHGVLASLAFVIFFPSGAIAIRLASFPGVIWLHAAFQVFAYAVYIAGFGLGVSMACDKNLINHHHAIIGMVLLASIFFMPALGWMHHAMFKKVGARTLWSYAHVWLGRSAIALGIINGGLGLRLANGRGNSSEAGRIVYGVVAGVMGVAWIAAMVIGETRRKKNAAAADNRPKAMEERRESERSDERINH